MQAPTQIRPPKNWQDFEMLCKKLWGEIWNCADTIKFNGRSGQNQCGVDIYGMPEGKIEYYGIQCKGKDQYIHAQLTKKEIDEEIAKARNFKPTLGALYFATTAVKDTAIEEYVREKNIENCRNGSFRIEVFCWEDIEDLLQQHQATRNWYINNLHYADSSDVSVVFKSDLSTFEIHPQYEVYLHWYYEMQHSESILNSLSRPNKCVAFPSMETKIDRTWCKVPIIVKNIGCTVLHDYMLRIEFASDNTFEIDDSSGEKRIVEGMPTIQSPLDNMSYIIVDEDDMSMEIRPRYNKLVQTDQRLFYFWIRPLEIKQTITLNWTFKSADYSKQGMLHVNSNAMFYKKYERDPVDLKDINNLHFEPRIIVLSDKH